MSLSYEERRIKILDQLSRDEKVSVVQLADELNVSSETIRRDLDRLDKEGKLKKVYGGAVKFRTDSWELPFEQKTLLNPEEKKAIGRAAASLVDDGDSIMLGNGTTPLEMVKYLAYKKNVTLVTHSAPVMLLALEVFKGRIIFIGGEVDVSQKSANGPLAEGMLQQLKVNKTFISAGGVSSVDGITDFDLNEANISRKMMERAEETIILADYTKLGKSTLARICSLNEVSIIISDRKCPDEWRRKLSESGIELMIAEDDG